MHLVAFLGTGPTIFHQGAWRHPATENDFLDGDFLVRLTQTLERAKFDAVFFADGLVLYDGQAEKGGLLYLLDPIVVAATVAQATSRIGIGITVSTSYFEPYGIARSLGSVDVLSKGRMAWNIVTGGAEVDAEARKFGYEVGLNREERYDRATEVVEACLQLWDSFPADAIVADRESGRFMDASKLVNFQYRGKYVGTEGPLNVPASPQGRPILMQAGSSPRGRDFAAQFAEVIFVVQKTADDIRAFVDDMTARLAKFGRSRSECLILSQVNVVVAETSSIARERWDLLNSLIDEETALRWASSATGVDLRGLPLDTPIRELDFSAVDPDGKGSSGYVQLLLQQAAEGEDITLRQAAIRVSNSAAEIVGDPDEVTDGLEELFRSGGGDGFILCAPVMPSGFEDFARLVIPCLRRRGLVAADYPGTTLRSTLFGLCSDE
ncbi:NtaA/DmoA family FMN-dependent monooxygenase [Mycobacterium saskatchewanense]|nr:NtaA/DmoA family FMN-dependent monooxygenase [Mycobacterium saskatchewanense]